MSAVSIAESIAEEQGWNDSTLLGLCLDYINNQQSNGAFEDHLRQNCADEDEDEDEDGPFKETFLDEDNGATLYCNYCGEQVRSNEAHTCPQQEEGKTPWALFNEDTSPEIQCDDELAEEEQTDDTAAVSFVKDLEQGTPEALAAAELFLKFHGRL